MTVNRLTKVNVGEIMHAPLSGNPRARGSVEANRASPYSVFFKINLIILCRCLPLPDIWSVISNAGGDGGHRLPTGITPQAHMGGLPVLLPKH